MLHMFQVGYTHTLTHTRGKTKPGSHSSRWWSLFFSLQRTFIHRSRRMMTFPIWQAGLSLRNMVGKQRKKNQEIYCSTFLPDLDHNIHVCITESEYRPLLPYSESTSQILLSSLNPVDNRKWRRKSWRWKVLKVLKVCFTLVHSLKWNPVKARLAVKIILWFVSCVHQTPLEVLLLLCIPVVDPDKEDRNWRRPLNCLHLITAPLVCVLVFQSGACKCLTSYNGSNMNSCSLLIKFKDLIKWCSFWISQMEIIWSTGSFPSGCYFFCWEFSCLLLSSAQPAMTVLPNTIQ